MKPKDLPRFALPRHRPTLAEAAAALQKRVPDVIRHSLDVLFCGINPGIYSASAGHHFAGPGNRFWPALHASGFTPALLRPEDDTDLLALGLGITNLVPRTTPKAEALSKHELRLGARRLARNARRYEPRIVAVLGLGAYRIAFEDPTATCGLQPRSIGATRIWLLPNPSGLNAHHSNAELARLFRALRRFERRRTAASSPGSSG